ncbi:ABC transporter ATP-binding protein [Nitrosomonas sp. JL21]|uniref:ABC transporter ATP-binding protein n=1 Tax=Nitrosomonas sp. JL21 TaxID=153949 RepID=UPI00137175FF|nr:ABC transporter ATP-binding protein [Nitrosomonas sp. JL21]MBL8498584.1 ABC transporter ATP-binding protein [Nitrosomonas sp.]MXS78982.1 ABC transporter ATP-binding protein [Nitrosomonas sp. JL21]
MSFSGWNSETAISAHGLSKCYQLYPHPKDRLKQFLWPHRWLGARQYYRELWALRDIDLTIRHGEVIGIVGQNGSGKSTLLQLVCGTLTPTQGEVQINGRVAALLELGAGFNPEFTGRENVHMSAAIMGLSATEIAERLEEIIDFSGVRDFIDQPVKTYSSGMFVRLAFSVAISVDPDILVIDEALSVGDGAFARKSFTRIMQMRDAGKTILFCSHSLFQVESLCTRALWIHQGQIVLDGESAQVVTAYQAFLDKNSSDPTLEAPLAPSITLTSERHTISGSAHLDKIKLRTQDIDIDGAPLTSGESSLSVEISFVSDPTLPCPTLAMALQTKEGRIITSAATWEDDFNVHRSADGYGQVCLTLDQLPLLKGEYSVSAYLLCERGLHLYDAAERVATLQIRQKGRLQGYFSIPHRWDNTASESSAPTQN